MSRLFLKSSCAIAALILSASCSATFAQTVEIGNVTQSAGNTSIVSSTGSVSAGSVSGPGSSVSATATGAQAGVSGTFINEATNFEVGNVNQTASQNAAPVNDPTPEVGTNAPVTVGDITGDGASAQKSATGAVSQVSATYIGATGKADFGNITQRTTDTPNRRIEAAGAIDSADANGLQISGNGASLSISSLGAASSVSLSGISANGASMGQVDIGNVDQTTRNTGQVQTNTGTVAGNGNLGLTGVSGDGASASISATGAASGISVSRIGFVPGQAKTAIGTVTQTTRNDGNGPITNTGNFRDKFDNTGGLSQDVSGLGASISSSATGAVSAVSISTIDVSSRGVVSVAEGSRIKQTTTNGSTNVNFPGSVTNTGSIEGDGTTKVSGAGATVSISAAGAVSAVSIASIESSGRQNITVGNVIQNTTNRAPIKNNNVDSGDVFPNSIKLGNITGAGASVGVSASGATSSVGISSISAKSAAGTPAINVGNITQTTVNSAAVTNNGGTIVVGNLTGNGSSVSSSAAGAVSQVALGTINSAVPVINTTVGNVAQTTRNSAQVTNTGAINSGGLSGAGASVSISAVGAASVVSASSIN